LFTGKVVGSGIMDNSMEKNVRMSWLLDFYGAFLTERQKCVMDLHYNYDLSLGEIAEQLKISRQGVHDALRRGESLLEEMEERLALLQRHKDVVYFLKHCINRMKKKELDSNDANIKEIIRDMERFLENWEDGYGL